MFKFSSKLHVWKSRVKKNGNSSLYLQVYISATGAPERDYFPLDLEWPMERIDFDNAMLLPRSKGDPDVNDYNMIIMSERNKFNEIAKVFRLSGRMLTIADLKREVIFADAKNSVIGYFLLKRKELYRRRDISEQTHKNYLGTINRLKEFDESVRFDQLNKKWMDRFKAFLKKSGNAPNTIWSRLKDVKMILRHADEEATIFVNPDALNYKNSYIKTPTTFLNKAEVRELMKLERSKSLKTEDQTVLQAFLFSCFTSLRISDIYAAERGWFLSDNFLFFTMHKNRNRKPKTIKVPLAPIAQDLVHSSLDRKLFKLPTEQEYNRTLKEIAVLANIKKRLTSHVGRHTFGYLFMVSVGDIFALKEIMGHSKIETTLRYAHLDEDHKMDMVMKMQKGVV